jgi:membrane fusion protein, multidrug efflux system
MNSKVAIVLMATALSLSNASCEQKQEASATKPKPVQAVKIERVTAAQVDDYYEAVGTVRAVTVSVLSARILGSVVALHVHEGDRVRAGQTLLEIDNRDASTQLQKAQAGLQEAQEALEEVERSTRAAESAKDEAEARRQLAKKTFDRYQELLERRSVSPQEFDEVQGKNRVAEAEAERADKMLQMMAARRSQALARIEQAKATIASARIYVGYAKVTSPFSGLVTAKQTEAGQTVTPGAPLLTIEDDSRYRLEVAVEEAKIANLRRGDSVTVLIDALDGTQFGAKVSEVVPTSDPASRSFTVKIDLSAEISKLGIRSGLFGKARFPSGQRQALLVPQMSVVERGQLIGVYVVDGTGSAHLRIVKTGKTYGDRIETLSGLIEGERIVSEGAGAIADGEQVEQSVD